MNLKTCKGEKEVVKGSFLDGILWLDNTFNLCEFSHGLIFLYKFKLCSSDDIIQKSL